MEEKRDKKRLIIRIAASVLIAVVFFGYLFSITMNLSLNDPDLWWHLRTGQYIVENWEVPSEDPFAYTTPRPLDEANKLGLRAQWLGQVLFHLAYSAGNLLGVGIFRSLLVIAPMLVLFVWLVKNKLNPLLALTVVAMPALFLSVELFYSFERPQGISFLLALLIIILIERAKKHGREGEGIDSSYWLLPLLTAFWSNIHAGFVVGNVIVMIYLGVAVLRAGYTYFRAKGPVKPAFMIVCAVALVASSANPNTYKLFLPYFTGMVSMFFQKVSQLTISGGGGGWVESVVLEYKPLYYFYKELGYTWLIYYWIFSVALYVAMLAKYILKRKFDLAEFLVVSFAVFFANYYARGLMFSLTILPFYFGKTVIELKIPGLRFKAALGIVLIFLFTITSVFANSAYRQASFMFRPGVCTEWVTPWYPTRLVEFLKAADIPGPMYNFYTWGGFLIWSLYPEHRVFIDGRAIDDLVNRTADAILKVYPGWESQLEAYHINFVVIPAVFRESGHIIPLAVELSRDSRWKLVFVRNNSLIFVRDVPQNKDIIFKYARDSKAVFREIIDVENIFISTMPGSPIHSLAKADALFALEQYQEAKTIYERFPDQAGERLRALQQMGY